MPDDALSSRFSPDAVAASVNERVREIMASAEAAAAELQREVEQATAQRATEVRLAAEEDGERIRREAEAAAAEYLDDVRKRVDAFAEGRTSRISELVDELSARAEAICSRLDELASLRVSLDGLAEGLQAAADAATAEASRPNIKLPGMAGLPDTFTSEQVAEVARDLPKVPRPARPAGPAAVPDPPSAEPAAESPSADEDDGWPDEVVRFTDDDDPPEDAA